MSPGLGLFAGSSAARGAATRIRVNNLLAVLFNVTSRLNIEIRSQPKGVLFFRSDKTRVVERPCCMEPLVVSADIVETEIRKRGKRKILTDSIALDLRRIFTEIKDGHLRALEELYTEVASRLFGLALWRTGSSEDAADVVQGVFVYVAENRQRLSDVRSPEKWLMTLTHRRAIDLIRGRQRRQQVPLEEIDFLEVPGKDHSRSIDAVQASEYLGRLPAGLRRRQRHRLCQLDRR